MIISSAWGGCGNLVSNIIHSSSDYKNIINYYKSINLRRSWTDQEWTMGPRYIYDDIKHTYIPDSIMVGWKNSSDTCFHYAIKNPKINHLIGNSIERHRALLDNNRSLENKFKRTEYWQMDHLLIDYDAFYNKCIGVNKDVQREHMEEIINLWKEKTLKFYNKNKDSVLEDLVKLVPDYNTTNFESKLVG